MDRTIIRGSSAYESENDTIGITSIVPEQNVRFYADLIDFTSVGMQKLHGLRMTCMRKGSKADRHLELISEVL